MDRDRQGPSQSVAEPGSSSPVQSGVGINDISIVPATGATYSLPDLLAKQEEEYLDLAAKRVQLEGQKQDIENRNTYAGRIFWLLCAWFVLLFTVLFLAGFKVFSFTLSDPVLLGLIGSTTANVIGIFLFVVRYLYPKR